MLFLSLLLFGSAAGQCPKFTCLNETTTEKCLDYDSKSATYKISYCTSDYICPAGSSQEAFCTFNKPIYSLRYPGEFCTWDSDCTSNSCVFNVCQGLIAPQTCINLYDCNPGYFCDPESGLCEEQAEEGGDCLVDEGCVNSAICIKGTCEPIFSQAVGYAFTDVDVNPNTGFNFACATGYAIVKREGVFQCAKAPVSKQAVPIQCELGTKCTASDGVSQQNCQCGYNEAGAAYCPLFIGDSIAQSMITNWIAISKYSSACNSIRRWSFECFATLSGEAQAAYNAWEVDYMLYNQSHYALIQNNPPCVQETYTKDYNEVITASTKYNTSVCPIYHCSPSSSYNQCILYRQETANFYVQETFYLSNCSESQVCPVTRTANSTCQSAEVQLAYPGDYCTENAQCLSGSCKSKKCQGLSEGDACINLYDCGPGLFCNDDSVCQEQVSKNGQCSDEYDCENNLICNLGICIPYFSLGTGAETDAVDYNGLSFACGTGFAKINSTTPLMGSCAAAPVSALGAYTCTPGSVCMDLSNIYSKPCTCGYSSEGLGYCPSFEGDKHLQAAITAFKKLMTYDVSCNTFSRKSENCWMRYPKYLKQFYYYATNFTMYQQFPYLQKNPDCADNIYNTEYYGLLERLAKGHFDDSKGNILTFCLGIAILIVGY
ncbi:unnamed protein product [Blepharisma stoltei]|uniref:Dickkopf N-terminal cysteine-rich domain-containing protein n=1 Tax=Blepharisma stoltei TaxID=1481888 RepID=A0AAU9K1T3_9CILI|nr:unnamed protein product [Blepharisma stoltei]